MDGSKPWVIGHIKSRIEHPELTWDVSNWRVEHRACSNRTGQAAVIGKAKADAIAGTRRVVLIFGAPGSGKTTYANSLGLDVLDADVDKAGYLERTRGLAADPTARVAVIRTCGNPAALEQARGSLNPTEVVCMDTPEAECIDRIKARGQGSSIGGQVIGARKWFEAWHGHDLTPFFPNALAHGQTPPLPISPPEALSQPVLSGFALPVPSNATGKPFETRAELAWDADYMRSVPWLAEFADVPEDASAPLWMTRPPEHATGSYGPEVIEWARTELKIKLRWWQRLAITLQLAHDADGVLVFRTFIDSAPRRAGKSVRMRTVALWRLAFSHLFGEVQLVMHTGSDLAICREIQRGAWVWATAKWGKDSVTKANGKEAIETWTGDRWLTRSQDAVYGYDVTLGMVDEGWDVKPETVNEGMEPATLERVMPQIHLTSTAHRRATSLMRTAISDALALDDPEVCLLLWGAPPGSDPSDPEVWRAASPHWSEDRRKLIARKYEKALAGEADPQADDPDPMAGFVAQYLNVWRLKARKELKGEPITDADTWDDLEAPRPDGTPAAAAIESWYSAGVSAALAWRDETGEVVVSVTDHPTLAAAAAHVSTAGLRAVTVGSSLLEDPTWKAHRLRPVKGEARTVMAVMRLAGMLREDTFRHDGGEHLTGQVLEARTLEGADGPRMAASGRTDAIKAAVWAAVAAGSKARRAGPVRVIIPSSARQTVTR